MAGIYIHIPFCTRLCNYCDFYKSISLAHKDSLPAALRRDMEHSASFVAEDTAESIYIGGGTPTIYSPDVLQSIIDMVGERFRIAPEAEITAEANPDDLSPEYLSALARTSINRLSIGTQSFDDGLLRFMNRRHDSRQAIEAVVNARKAGIDNISADIIFGIPGQSHAQLRKDLDTLISLGVEHISAYHLTIEEKTVFGRREARGELAPIAEEESERQFRCVHSVLTAAGYDHYEVSNYALPGFRARHNSGYWHGMCYLGLGPAAHSYNGAERRWNAASVKRYIDEAGSDSIYQSETLSADDLYDEYVMTALRCREGVDTKELEDRFGAHKLLYFESCAKRLLASGTLMKDGTRYYIPPEELLISDNIICEFFV